MLIGILFDAEHTMYHNSSKIMQSTNVPIQQATSFKSNTLTPAMIVVVIVLVVGVVSTLTIPLCAFAANDAVVVNNSSYPCVLLPENSSIAFDPSRTLDITTIASPEFAYQFQPLANVGTSLFTESAVWWRVTLINQTGKACFFHAHTIGTDTIDVYVPSAQGEWMHHRYGHLVKSDRHGRDWQAAIEIPINTAEPTTLYIRKVARYAIFIYGSVGTEQAMYRADKERSMFNIGFLGIGCAMLVYNFFVFISLRSKAYVFYLCYTALLLLHHVFMMGKLDWVLGSAAAMVVHQYGLTTLAMLTSMAMILFTWRFLQVWRYSTKVLRALQLMFSVHFLIILLELMGVFYPTLTFVSRQCISVSAGLMSLLCLASGVIRRKLPATQQTKCPPVVGGNY